MTTIIKLIARILIASLWIRFILRIASVAATGIVADLYRITDLFVRPFQGILPNAVLAGKFTVEFNTLLAIVVYAFVEFILIKIFGSRRENY